MNPANAPCTEPATPTAPPTAIPNQPLIDCPPRLPLELIEGVLTFVPLRFPLSKLGQYSSKELKKAHKHCAAVLNVAECSRQLAKVVAPRLDGRLRLVMGNVDRFGVDFLQRSYEHGFRFDVEDAWHVAMEYNRVDVLDWLVNSVKIPKPKLLAIAQDPVSVGLQHGSWDALDWLAQADLAPVCDGALPNAVLADLVRSQGERQLCFAELWLQAGYAVDENDDKVLAAALDVGCLRVLDAWTGIHDYCGDEDDQLCSVAIRGQGPVVPLLDWMLARQWDLPNVAEYASEAGKLDVLEWWKVNKEQIDAQLEERHDQPSVCMFGYRMLEQEQEEREEAARARWPHLDPVDLYEMMESTLDADQMEVEPDWLSQLKHGRESCLELARSNGHQHVLDWWRENEDLLPMPNSVRLVNDASGSGDLQFLQAWKVRWDELERSGTYDCDRALCVATKGGHIEVLEWWINDSDVDFEVSEDLVLRAALESDHFETMVDWWINKSDVEMCDSTLAHVINRCDKVELLDRWNQIGRPLPFNVSSALRYAAKNSRINILDWWKYSGIRLDKAFRPGATTLVDAASAKCAIGSLNWIRALCTERGFEFQYSEDALDDIFWDAPFSCGSTGGCVQFKTVEWWSESGMELKFSESAFRNAIFCLSNSELTWWLKESLPVNYSAKCAMVAVRRCGEQVIRRLEAFGLKIDYEDAYDDEYCYSDSDD